MAKYALFDFFDSKTIEVGETASIVWGDGNEPPDLNVFVAEQRVVRVMWLDKKSKSKASKCDRDGNSTSTAPVYQARILRISDDRTKLRRLANDVVNGRCSTEDVIHGETEAEGRGLRRKKKRTIGDESDTESDEDLPLKQSAANAKKLLKTSKADAAAEMLKEMKQRRQNEQTGDKELTVHDLETENQRLRNQNEHLQHALTALSYLPGLVSMLSKSDLPRGQQLVEADMKRFQRSNSTSVVLSATSKSPAVKTSTAAVSFDVQQPEDDESSQMAEITTAVLAKCNKQSAQKMLNDLMTSVFTEEYLASHSLGGKSSKESCKRGIPSCDIQTIIATVRSEFTTEDPKHIRAYIRGKLNNVDKTYKKKYGRPSTAAEIDN